MHQIGGKLRVTSLDTAENFYCNVLGLEFAGGDAKHILAKASGGYLALALDDRADGPNVAAPRVESGVVIVTPFHRSLLPSLVEAGAVLLQTSEPPWGGYETVLADPFGNVVSLFSVGG